MFGNFHVGRSGKNASGTKKLSKFTLEKKNDFLIVFDFSNLSGTKMQREGEDGTCTHTPTTQLLAEDTKQYERIVRHFLTKPLEQGNAVYAVPVQLHDMHKRACTTICAATMLVHTKSRGNSIILVPTQINVYFVWLAWMQAMHATYLQPMHPKADYADYFKNMEPEKIVVLLPVVCLWICVKCMESWKLGCKDILRLLQGVQQSRNYQVHFTFEDVLNTEHILLQLIDCDVLKNQENVDRIEDILSAHLNNFEEVYVTADQHVVRSLFCIFYDVVDKIE